MRVTVALLPVLLLSALSTRAWAEEPVSPDQTIATIRQEASGARRAQDTEDLKRGFGFEAQAAYIRQFDSGIDDGGHYTVDRTVLQLAPSYAVVPGVSVPIWLGYRYDGYQFSGDSVFGQGPWGDVHSFRVSLPVFVPVGEKFFGIGVPFVRTTAEDGADFGDAVTWGFFAGAGYKVSDRLSIGPGFGYVTEIEDNPSWFPVLIIDWEITRTLNLKTGQGLGATQGPGLFLHWTPNDCWEVLGGVRFDRNRFRLDDRGIAPEGVGDESYYAGVVGAQYSPNDRFSFDVLFGVTVRGELRLEDRRGSTIAHDKTDPGFFAGIGFTVTF